MDTDSPVKDILYQELENITEKQIQLEISKNNSSKIISKIISKCLPKIQNISQNIDEDVGIFAESLMHYLLTISLISSQRKIVQNDVEIDIVLPDLKTLSSNPKDSLVIFFPKSNDKNFIQKKIQNLEKIQQVKENIWIVMLEDLGFKSKIYQIRNFDNSFVHILNDINGFFSSKKKNKFKIMKS